MTLPLDLSPLAWTWLALLVFGAAYIRGYSGFGFAALVMSGAAVVTDPVALAPAALIADMALGAPQWPEIRRAVDWRRVAALAAGCVPGVPLGLWAIGALGADAARLALSSFVLVMALVLLRGWRLARPAGMPAHAGVGVVSGIANGAAVGGLPVAAFFAAQPIPPAAFRATLIAYFLVLDAWTLPLMWQADLLDTGALGLVGLGLPLMLGGLWLGSRRFRAAPPDDFRRMAVLLLLVLAVLGLLRAAL